MRALVLCGTTSTGIPNCRTVACVDCGTKLLISPATEQQIRDNGVEADPICVSCFDARDEEVEIVPPTPAQIQEVEQRPRRN